MAVVCVTTTDPNNPTTEEVPAMTTTTPISGPPAWTTVGVTPLAPGISVVLGGGAKVHTWPAVCLLHERSECGGERVTLGLLDVIDGEVWPIEDADAVYGLTAITATEQWGVDPDRTADTTGGAIRWRRP